jgi:hypothetical protein
MPSKRDSKLIYELVSLLQDIKPCVSFYLFYLNTNSLHPLFLFDIVRSPKNLRWVAGYSNKLRPMSVPNSRLCCGEILANRKYQQKKKGECGEMRSLIVGIFCSTEILGNSMHNYEGRQKWRACHCSIFMASQSPFRTPSLFGYLRNIPPFLINLI